MNIEYLYHYYEEKNGPFINLSELSIDVAMTIQQKLKYENKVFAAKRSDGYLERRRELEQIVYNQFVQKGGKPKCKYAQYMIIEECPWMESWYEKPKYIKIKIVDLNMEEVSFTYGDMFPTFSKKVNDKKEYRNTVYTYDEIIQIIQKYGLPQKWNIDGKYGTERYVEAHVWNDDIKNLISDDKE